MLEMRKLFNLQMHLLVELVYPTCGALVGGLLAISSIVGRSYNAFSAGDGRRVFRYSKRPYDRFIEEYGSPICRDIHRKLFGRTFNLLDKHEYEEFKDGEDM